MLINEKDAIERLASPLNLLNRMRSSSALQNNRNKAMSLFVPPASPQTKELTKPFQFQNPFEKPEPETEDEIKAEAETEAQLVPASGEVKVDNLIDNADAQIKLARAHDLALDTLTRSVQMLGDKLDDVKADKLPAVISATSKVVEGIRRERNEAAKSKNGRDVHLHFYSPVQKQEQDYEIIEVN